MSFSVPVNITVVISFIIFIFYLLGIQNLLTSYPENGCEMTFMFQYPQFVEISMPSDVRKSYPKYALYGYGEGGFTEQLRKMKFNGIPVLFLPGSSGSHKQGRSLASISLRKSFNSKTSFHFDYFMIDFNEEQAALYGAVLEEQAKFASHCIKKILSLYQKNNDYKKPESVILIGHSMGGLHAKGVFLIPDFDPQQVRLVITLATPHKYPLLQPDSYIPSYYKKIEDFWRNSTVGKHTNLISIGGGLKDIIVRADVTRDPYSDINVLSSAVAGVWLPNDHLSIMWCKQLILTIIRAIFDCVDFSTKQLSIDKEHISKVFQYHLLKRNAGKHFSGSHTTRFSSFEQSPYWFENLQRQFTITEYRGLKNNHYIMIRLFSDPRNEAVFIDVYNINVKDWLFVCSADVVYNSVRMCNDGENISNITEIAPVNPKTKLKRKFVYLNLFELKAKSFTHVLIKLPASDSFMSVNVDIHQPSERNIVHQVPKFYSTSPKTVIESTQDNSAYYLVTLVGFEYIWQSYILRLHVLSCKTDKNNAVVSFITPWTNEDQHFMFDNQNTLSIELSLISPMPKISNSTFSPLIRLHLDPTCKYKVTIQPSIIGMFAQGARYYSLMLPAFLATVALLTVRQQIIYSNEAQCVLFHSALSSAVRRYYVILQATILGSKVLGLGLCLTILPVPDFVFLQELCLDSFFLTVLLYAVAISFMYLLGVVCYITIVISGQAAHKMALRFVAKAISGVFYWSEWIISALHKVPLFVAVILISLALSTSGAVSLWLGTFFYFLKLCKMYEEYLEDWFHYSIKQIALKVKNVVNVKAKTQVTLENTPKVDSKNEENLIIGDELNAEGEKEAESSLREKSQENKNNSVEVGLSALHFHVSVFIIWLLMAFLYIPSLLMWAKNYHFSIYLEKDPALIPSVVVNACGAVLWQTKVPKPSRKVSQITSSCLFLLAVLSIIYASLALYRLGFILAASLVILSLNQIFSEYI